MESILFILLFITVPFFLFTFLKLNNIDMFKPELFSITFWGYLFFAYIGIFPLYFGWDKYRVAAGITDKSIILFILIYSASAFVIISITYVVFMKVFKKFGQRINKFNSFKSWLPLNVYQSNFILLLLIFSTVVFMIYLFKIPEIPIFAQIKGYSTLEIKQFRSLATNDFSGSYYLYKLFFDTVYTLVCLSLFANYLVKRTNSSLRIFLISFFLSSFAAIYSTQKAPFIWLLIALLLTYLITLSRKISLKYIFRIGLAAIIFLFFFYRTFMGLQDRGALEVFGSMLSRAITGQISPAYYYLELFPKVVNYLHGTSFPNPNGIFPFEHYRLTVEVMNMKFSNLSDLGIVGSAPTAFWGEAFANFGYLGIIVSSFYIGILLTIVHLVFLHSKKSVFNIAVYVWMILEFNKLSSTGISNFIFNLNIISVLLIWLTFNYITFHRLKFKSKHT
ncbi:O-antigen polymerase [Siminovitchia sediminis]|uniref:O-antigen polymerase n=1 Tax=Siminovitchia sediminis TaxID=1274353 RepID=A0ABW4KHQ2_9BACI